MREKTPRAEEAAVEREQGGRAALSDRTIAESLRIRLDDAPFPTDTRAEVERA